LAAVQIAHALGDPSTVLEVSGATFADALAAGPAAAAVSGVVLLTNGAVMPDATAAYLANHAQNVWAVGGPAAAADPAATPIVGGDRYQTAANVANQFISNPSVIGVATGASFPDALAAGAQLAQAGGALLLVGPDSVPDATAGYVNSHGGVPMLLYGGANAVTSLVAGIL
jgi:putative cell wall-binding protein